MTTAPRLYDQIREKIRQKHYSYRTEQQYLGWIKRYIVFHGKRHPRDLGAKDVEAFLGVAPIQPDRLRVVDNCG